MQRLYLRAPFLATVLSFALHESTSYAASFNVVYSFNSSTGESSAGLVAIKNNLYGTTDSHVFSITPAGSYQIIHTYAAGEGSSSGALIHYNNVLYGVCEFCGPPHEEDGTVYSVTTSGKLTTLFSYGNYYGSNGVEPFEPLLKIGNNLYAVTGAGGNGDAYNGTAISITLTGGLNWVYEFPFGGSADSPRGGLVRQGGRLYGTTLFGGSADAGSVYWLSTKGAERTIYEFRGGSDGAYPESGMTSVNSILYGTTTDGGQGCTTYGCGTVFSITPSGKEAVIYRFHGGEDGSYPAAPLTYANGVFYGTTTYGGGSGCSDEQGCGTVFSLTPQGTENVLYRFTGSTDGEYPSSLIFVGGALYGTTSSGGANGYGTVFKVVP